MDAVKMIGANGKRREMDFYPTPPEVTRTLVDFLLERRLLWYGDTVWECAAGDGDMAAELAENGLTVCSTDLRTGDDFLTCEPPREDVRWIITNPPFSHAEAFIRRAAEYNIPFAFLLKSQFWHAHKRREMFGAIKPGYVLPLTWRPDFTGHGSSLMDVCWNVWLPGSTWTQYIPLERRGHRDGRRDPL